MEGRLVSVRMRSALLGELRLLAAAMSRSRQTRITMRSLLEEGTRGLFTVSLEEWVSWARRSVTTLDLEADTDDAAGSQSFRIDADLAADLGVLAARIALTSKVPITKVHLLEEAGSRIIAQVKAEQKEAEAY